MRLRELLAVIAFALTLTAGSFVLIGGGDEGVQASPSARTLHAAQNECLSALVFSKTDDFRHDSISDGLTALTQIGAARGWTVVSTEDATQFNSNNLNNYDVVVFLNTSGEVLNSTQEAAFESYIAGGGGYFGVHAASNTEENWPWYEGLVGAYVSGHPGVQFADVLLEDGNHPATAHLPATWNRRDEWYSFQTNPRGNVNVLLNIDQNSYEQGPNDKWAMGENHPLAWYQSNYQGGRSIYTALGHTTDSYAEPDFRLHLQGALEWAASTDCLAFAVTPPATLNVDASTRFPIYRWTDANTPIASWYQVIVQDSEDNPVYNQWFKADGTDLCTGETCEVQHTGAVMPDGDYTLTVEAYFAPDIRPVSDPHPFTVAIPAAVTGINAEPNQGRPTVTWTRASHAEWFRLYIGQPGIDSYIKWFSAEEICSGTACSVMPPTNLRAIDGGYQVWVRGWSEANRFDPWVQAASNLVFNDQPAGLPTNITAVNPTAAVPTLEWTAGTNATWYDVLVYKPDASPPGIRLGWSDVVELGCAAPGSTCSLTDNTLDGKLGSGEYFIYVRAWGPGGMSTGGPYPNAPQWAEGTFTR